MQAVRTRSRFGELLVFPSMGTQPAPHPQPNPNNGYHPPTHGNWAQWGAIIVALLIGAGNFGMTWWFHYADSASKSSDEHVNVLIDNKLNPTTQEIKKDIESKAGTLQTQLTELDNRVGRLEGRLDQLIEDEKRLAAKLDTSNRVRAASYENQLMALSQKPFDPKSIEQVKRVLSQAVENGVQLDPVLLQNTSEKFIEASYKHPDAWSAIPHYLDYRSYLNANYAPLLKDPFTCEEGNDESMLLMDYTAMPQEEWARIKAEPNKQHVVIECSGGDYIPPEKTARLEWGRMTPPRPPNTKIALYRVRENFAIPILIDGMNMKNVVFENSTLEFQGDGLPILDHVWFINCTFIFKQKNDISLELSKAIMASVPIIFLPTHY